jgi:peptide/nickel transport system permease protein
LAQTRHQLGLDRPATVRYREWITGLVHGDMGQSLLDSQPVSAVIEARIGNTAILGGLTILIMVPLALAIGIFSGTREGRRSDRAVSSVTLFVIAIPEFVIAAILIALFALAWKLLPAASLIPSGKSPLSAPSLLVLPVLALVIPIASSTSRQIRAGVADVMRARHVELARLKGVPERYVIVRHVLPNAIAPSIQVIASSMSLVIGGSVIVETVFAYPGIGSALAAAVTTRNFPLVEGIVMLLATVLLIAYMLADLAVVLLNPKLRTALS